MTVLDAFRARHGLTGPSPAVTRTAGRLDLCALFAALGFRHGAEIGVWTGRFSEQLCRTVPSLRLIAVDPWQPYAAYREKKNDPARLEAAYRETCARLAPYDCEVLRLTSIEAARQVPDGSLDFVYLDGNHARDFVLEDLAAWTPKIRAGGILAGHDYRTQPAKPFIEVEQAVDAWARDQGIEPWFVLAAERTPSFFWVVS